MWIVFQKKDRRVVGMSAAGANDPPKLEAIAEIVRGLVNKGAEDTYDAVQVTDPAEVASTMSGPLHHLVIEETPKGKQQRMTVQRRGPALLVIRSDAPDLHEADGIPGIAADGTSFTTITVQKVSASGEPQTARSDNDTVYLRTTAGTLVSADGKEPVAKLKLKQGQASFRLVSEKARRVATVTAFNADEMLENAAVQVEFI
jgi:hypothetical protein